MPTIKIVPFPGIPGPKGETGAAGPKGDTGDQGPAGANGLGVPSGGTAGQVLAKASGTNYDTEWVDEYSPGYTISVVTQAAYDALTPDANTIYIISG